MFESASAFFKQPTPTLTGTLTGATLEGKLRISLAMTFVTLFVSIKLYLCIHRKIGGSPRDIQFVKEYSLCVIASFTQRTYHIDPQSSSLRIKCLVGFAFGMVCFTAYSASIISSLSNNRAPLRTFHDLINAKFLLTVHERSFTFQNLLHGIITSKKMEQKVEIVSTAEEVSQLFHLQGNDVGTSRKAILSFADLFHQVAGDSNYSQLFLCEHISSVKLPWTEHLTISAMLVKKGSHFREILNYMYATNF